MANSQGPEAMQLTNEEMERAVAYARRKAARAMAKLVNAKQGTDAFSIAKAERDFWEKAADEYQGNLDRGRVKG